MLYSQVKCIFGLIAGKFEDHSGEMRNFQKHKSMLELLSESESEGTMLNLPFYY